MRSVSGAFISHSHSDHSKAAKDLARFGTDVYTSRGTMDACGLHGHRFHPVKALEQISVGTFDVLPFDVEHDAPEPLGFLFASRLSGEKLLFFTDTYYIKYRFTGLNVIAAECNYSKRQLQDSISSGSVPIDHVTRLMRSHMSLEHLKDMLQANDLSKLRAIYLLHMSEDNGNEAQMLREIRMLTGVEVYAC